MSALPQKRALAEGASAPALADALLLRLAVLACGVAGVALQLLSYSMRSASARREASSASLFGASNRSSSCRAASSAALRVASAASASAFSWLDRSHAAPALRESRGARPRASARQDRWDRISAGMRIFPPSLCGCRGCGLAVLELVRIQKRHCYSVTSLVHGLVGRRAIATAGSKPQYLTLQCSHSQTAQAVNTSSTPGSGIESDWRRLGARFFRRAPGGLCDVMLRGQKSPVAQQEKPGLRSKKRPGCTARKAIVPPWTSTRGYGVNPTKRCRE